LQFILGIPSSAWNRISANLEDTLYDTAISILARYYAENPDKLPLKQFKASTAEYLERIKELRPEGWRECMGRIVGRDDHTSYYRWYRYDKNFLPPSERIAALVINGDLSVFTQIDEISQLEQKLKSEG